MHLRTKEIQQGMLLRCQVRVEACGGEAGEGGGGIR